MWVWESSVGDREREYVGVWVCGEREGSRVQKGSNAPDGAGSKERKRWGQGKRVRVLGDRERNVNQVAFESGLIWLYRTGKSLQTTSQIVGKLTPKYPWIKRFRIATICDHGISGCLD